MQTIPFFIICYFLRTPFWEFICGTSGLLNSSYCFGSDPHRIRYEQLTIHLCISSAQESHRRGSKFEKGFFTLCAFMRVDFLRKAIQCKQSRVEEFRSKYRIIHLFCFILLLILFSMLLNIFRLLRQNQKKSEWKFNW